MVQPNAHAGSQSSRRSRHEVGICASIARETVRAHHAASHAIDRLLTLTVAASTFVLRWLTLDFDNDYFMHMAGRRHAARPVARACLSSQGSLQTWLAYRPAVRRLSTLVGRFIACAFVAISTALAYALCRRMGIPRWLSFLVVVIAVATFPRLYTYPKAFVYPAAIWALMCYQDWPNRRSLILVALATAVAFLFRHDHGVWIVAPTVIGFAYCHWREPKVLLRTVVAYGMASLVLVSPWLIWVALSGHAGQY
jgi:hypothetical protein